MSPAAINQGYSKAGQRWWLWAVGTIVALLLGTCALVAYCLHQTLENENCLHAWRVTCQRVSIYVREHHGKGWPHKWEDVPLAPAGWPEDRRGMEKYVAIDFGAAAADLLSGRPEDVRAISPRRSIPLMYRIEGIETIRDAIHGRGGP